MIHSYLNTSNRYYTLECFIVRLIGILTDSTSKLISICGLYRLSWINDEYKISEIHQFVRIFVPYWQTSYSKLSSMTIRTIIYIYNRSPRESASSTSKVSLQKSITNADPESRSPYQRATHRAPIKTSVPIKTRCVPGAIQTRGLSVRQAKSNDAGFSTRE